MGYGNDLNSAGVGVVISAEDGLTVKKVTASSEYTPTYRSDYDIYQAIITNPLDMTLSNQQMAIYVKFNRGECKNEACIELYDGATKLPFQWENDIHPNPKIGEDFGTYADNSLKSGTIWFMGSLSIGETKTLTIRVYEKDRTNVYTPSVTYTNVDTTTVGSYKDALIANGVEIRMHEDLGWMLRYVYVNGTEMIGGTVAQRISIKDNTYTDHNTNIASELTGLTRSLSGSGVIFKDFVSTAKWAYNNNIRYIVTVRMWANGRFDIHNRVMLDTDMAAGVLNGINFKFAAQNVGGVSGSNYKATKVGASSLLMHVKYWQYLPDAASQSTPPSYQAQLLSGGDVNFVNLFCFWQYTTPNNYAFLKGMSFSSLYTFTSNLDTADSTSLNNARLRMMNTPRTTLTKYTEKVLKNRLIALTKNFILANNTDAQADSASFPLLVSLGKLACDEIKGIDDLDSTISVFKSRLLATYGGTDADTMFSKYPARGIEYIGRDMSALKYFRLKCIQKKRPIDTAYFENLIHAVADLFVKIETYSGANGQVYLSSTVFDNMNAEACAMHFIRQSLDLKEDTTRRTVYNRIKSRFEGGLLYRNILPYSIGLDVHTEMLSSYHGFSLYDYLQAVDTPTFHVYNYVMDYNTPSGFAMELGFNKINGRMGQPHQCLYTAFILQKAGTISTLQQAVTMVEHLLSRCYPNGGVEYPLDGWTPNQGVFASIPQGLASEIVLSELYA